jgi:predicted nucleotidyltransferase
VIDGENLTETLLKKENAATCKTIIILVENDLVDIVANYIDPILA